MKIIILVIYNTEIVSINYVIPVDCCRAKQSSRAEFILPNNLNNVGSQNSASGANTAPSL